MTHGECALHSDAGMPGPAQASMNGMRGQARALINAAWLGGLECKARANDLRFHAQCGQQRRTSVMLQARPFRFQCTTTHLDSERAAAMAQVPVDAPLQSFAGLDLDLGLRRDAAALPAADAIVDQGAVTP